MSRLEDLNDKTSDIYQNTLTRQLYYIDERLKIIKSRFLERNIRLVGNTKEEIAEFLNLGIAQNLVNSFFNFKESECIICKKNKSDSIVRQLERAHCNNFSRVDVLLMALDKIYVDIDTPINTTDILIEFIKCHKMCPIYYLCNICHTQYDKKILSKDKTL